MTFAKLPPEFMNRRAVMASLAALGLPFGVQAQAAWPNRTVKIIDAAAPGGSTDIMARMVANKLAPRLGQSFVVENKPGAGMTMATDFVSRAAPDGHTMLLASTGMCIAAASGKKLPYDYLKDLRAVAQIGITPLIIVVAADSKVKTLRDLVDMARAKPGEVRYSSSGIASMSHIGMELLGSVAKVKMLHVPYRGVSLSIPDLLSGEVHCALGTVATYSALLDSGKMRAIAVASPQRSTLLPNVPSAAESGLPDYSVEFWWGLMAPAGVPTDVVRRINAEVNTVLGDADTKESMLKLAGVPRAVSPEEFARINAFEVDRWGRLMRDANIQVE